MATARKTKTPPEPAPAPQMIDVVLRTLEDANTTARRASEAARERVVARLRELGYLYVALDVLALCGYLALIAAMSGDFTWYLGIVLPLLVLIGAATLLMMLIIRRREMLKLYRAALSLVLLATFIVGLEAIIDLSLWQQVALGWSVYTGIPLVILALMAAALQHNKAVKEAIRKRLFL